MSDFEHIRASISSGEEVKLLSAGDDNFHQIADNVCYHFTCRIITKFIKVNMYVDKRELFILPSLLN
jgi:hypothetical protein